MAGSESVGMLELPVIILGLDLLLRGSNALSPCGGVLGKSCSSCGILSPSPGLAGAAALAPPAAPAAAAAAASGPARPRSSELALRKPDAACASCARGEPCDGGGVAALARPAGLLNWAAAAKRGLGSAERGAPSCDAENDDAKSASARGDECCEVAPLLPLAPPPPPPNDADKLGRSSRAELDSLEGPLLRPLEPGVSRPRPRTPWAAEWSEFWRRADGRGLDALPSALSERHSCWFSCAARSEAWTAASLS